MISGAGDPAMLYATIFLVCFVLLGGLVMYLSRTIDAGEARFDKDGKIIRDEDEHKGRKTR